MVQKYCHQIKILRLQDEMLIILSNIKLKQKNETMGCVNTKHPGARSKRPQSQALTQPDIPHDEQPHPHQFQTEVSSKACGYEFTLETEASNYHTQDHNGLHMGHSSQITPVAELKTLLNKCEQYYRDHDLDTANDYLSLVDNLTQKYQGTQLQPQFNNLLAQHQRVITCIRQQYRDIMMYENEILRGGWVQKSNRKGVKVSTRREDGTVGVLVQSIIEQPFEVLISCCIEMDLYKQFMPFMKVSRQEKIADRNCRIGFTENHIPIVSVRQAFFQGIGYNRLHKNNTLFLFTRSIHNRPDLEQKLGYKCHINPDNVQLEYKYFVLWYEPLARGKGKITLAMNVDTKLNFIPMWIQDKISQDFGEEFFANIIKLSKRFKNSQWEKNTTANPQLFLFFKNAIDQRLHEMEEGKRSTSKVHGTITSASTENNVVMSGIL